MLLGLGSGRFGKYVDPETEAHLPPPDVDFNFFARQLNRAPRFWQRLFWGPRWFIRGYNDLAAGDLAAAVAYHALIAMLPVLFLLITVAGYFLGNDDEVLERALELINQVFPSNTISTEAFQQAIDARQNSGLISIASVFGFAWAGMGFVSSLARAINRVYGVRGSSFLTEKRRAFVVLIFFTLLFVISSVIPIVTTFFINRELPDFLERWISRSLNTQLIAYGISYVSAMLLFVVIYRVLPNAGQDMTNIWPGTMVAALLFLLVTQVFPLYVQIIDGVGRNGQIFGFILLLVASLFALAHVMLVGAFVNAGYLRNQRQRRRARRARQAAKEKADRDAPVPMENLNDSGA